MSVHAIELIEKPFKLLPKSNNRLWNAAVDDVEDKIKSAVCFYIGDLFEIDRLKIIPDLVRLPYPICWFEGHVSGHIETVQVGILCWESEHKIYAHAFLRENVQRTWAYWFSWLLHSDGNADYFGTDNFDDSCWFYEKGVLPLGIATVERFLSALHCTNINQIEHRPPEKLQKARTKRGKQPLFSYWTLEIDLPKSRAAGEDYGGTHASPRLHLRRGHPRQYAPGKYCWVQPCVVGNKAAGMVHKDYSANYARQ